MSAVGQLVHSFTAHFIQRWNFVKKNKYESNEKYQYLPPAFGIAPSVTDAIGPLGRQFAERLHLSHGGSDTQKGIYAQLCRSATKWSQGVEHEKSIQNAYIDLITNANRISILSLCNSRFRLHRESIFQYILKNKRNY